jgi:hypothetical protein
MAKSKSDGSIKHIAPSEDPIEERPGTRIRALLARTRPLTGNEVPDAYRNGRSLLESLALSYDVESDLSWGPAQCSTVLEFLSSIEPTAGNCFCNDKSTVNATCGFHVILDFMADEMRRFTSDPSLGFTADGLKPITSTTIH